MAAAGVGEGNSVSVSFTGDATSYDTTLDKMSADTDSTTSDITASFDQMTEDVTADLQEIQDKTTETSGDVTIKGEVTGDAEQSLNDIDTAKTKLQTDPDIALNATLDDATPDGTVKSDLDDITTKITNLEKKKAELEVSLAQGTADGTVKSDLDDITAKIDDLKKKKAALEVSLSDSDIKSQLDDIDAKMKDLAKEKAALEVSLNDTSKDGDVQTEIDDINRQMKDLDGEKAELLIKLSDPTDDGDVSSKLEKISTKVHDMDGETADVNVKATDVDGSVARVSAEVKTLKDEQIEINVTATSEGLTPAEAAAVADLHDQTIVDNLTVEEDPNAEPTVEKFKDEVDTATGEHTATLNAEEDDTEGGVAARVQAFKDTVNSVDDVDAKATMGVKDSATLETDMGSFDETVEKEIGSVHAYATMDVRKADDFDAKVAAAKKEASGVGGNTTIILQAPGKPSKNEDQDLDQGLASGFASFLSNAGLTDLGNMVESTLKADKIVVFAAGGALVTGLAGMIAGAMPGLGGAVLAAFMGQNNAMKTKLSLQFGLITTQFSKDVADALAGPGGGALTYTKKTAPTAADIGKVIPLGGALGALLTSVGVMEQDLVQPTKDFGAGMTEWCAALDKIISSKGFKDLLNQVSSVAEGSSTEWGTIVGQFLTGIGQMLVAMEPLETTVLSIFSSMAASFSGNKAKGAEDKFFDELNNFLTKDAPDLKSMFDSIGTLSTTLITIITKAGPGIAAITSVGAVSVNAILEGLGSLLGVLNSLGEGGKVVSGAVVIALLASYKLIFTKALPELFKAIWGLTVPKKGVPTPGGVPSDSTNPNLTTAAAENIQKGGAAILKASENMTKSAAEEEGAATEEEGAATEQNAASLEENAAGLEEDAAAAGAMGKGGGGIIASLLGKLGGGTILGDAATVLAPLAATAAVGAGIYAGANALSTLFTGFGKDKGDIAALASLGTVAPAGGPPPVPTKIDTKAMADSVFLNQSLPPKIQQAVISAFSSLSKTNTMTNAEVNTLGNYKMKNGKNALSAVDTEWSTGGKTAATNAVASIADVVNADASVKGAFTKLGENAEIAINKQWDIGSPSKVFKEVGKNSVQGLINGISDDGMWDTLKSELGVKLDNTTAQFKTAATTMGSDWSTALAAGTIAGLAKVVAAATTMGSDWSTALAAGITAEQASVVAAATNMANAAVAAVQAVFAKANSTTTITNSVNIPITTGTGVIPNNVVTQIQGVVYSTLNDVAQASASSLRQT